MKTEESHGTGVNSQSNNKSGIMRPEIKQPRNHRVTYPESHSHRTGVKRPEMKAEESHGTGVNS